MWCGMCEGVGGGRQRSTVKARAVPRARRRRRCGEPQTRWASAVALPPGGLSTRTFAPTAGPQLLAALPPPVFGPSETPPPSAPPPPPAPAPSPAPTAPVPNEPMREWPPPPNAPPRANAAEDDDEPDRWCACGCCCCGWAGRPGGGACCAYGLGGMPWPNEKDLLECASSSRCAEVSASSRSTTARSGDAPRSADRRASAVTEASGAADAAAAARVDGGDDGLRVGPVVRLDRDGRAEVGVRAQERRQVGLLGCRGTAQRGERRTGASATRVSGRAKKGAVACARCARHASPRRPLARAKAD